MGRQIVHRLLISFPALLGVLFLCFCLLQVVPADPAMIIAGPDAKAETIAAIRLELGLDRSIPVQFFEYILRVLRGDLGRSIISNRMVSEELAMTIGPTVELMLGAMLIAVPSGLALGTLAAVNRGRIADRIIMACSVAGVSMPVFFIGLILIQYVGFKWALLPFTGRTGPVWDGGLPSLILPALTLGAVLIGPIARLTRTAVLEVLGADFVRTARAKGLRETVVIVHHALRNALIPVVTLIGLQAAFLLGGAVVTETMFSWPGVGRLAVGAIVSSDFPTAQGAIMILAIAFLSINLLVDVLYVYLDPRVQRTMSVEALEHRLCRRARHRRVRPRRRAAPAGARQGGRDWPRWCSPLIVLAALLRAVDRALRSLLHRSHQGDAAARAREHWFGTDNTGRDILSRVIYGTRNTLMLGLVGVIVGGLHRRRARHPRRLLPPARRLDHAAGRRDAGLPRDPDRARGGRDLRRRA